MKAVRLILCLCTVMLVQTVAIDAWEVKDDSGTLFKVNGLMQYRGRKYNLDFNDSDNKSSYNRQNYFGNLSLKFTITPSDYITGCFELNKLVFLGQRYRYNTIQTGESISSEDVDFMLADGSTVKLPLQRNTDEAWELHMRQAWMDVMFPGGIPMKLKFGRQPFMLGNGIYTNTNLASVFGWQFYSCLGPDKPSLRVGSMKYYEGIRENYNAELGENDPDDADVYFIDYSMPVPIGKSKAGAFLTHFRDNSLGKDALYHYNLGLTADLGLDCGWSVSGEFNIQTGKKEYDAPTETDIDWNGYGLMLKVGAPALFNNKVKLLGEFGLGSGDDPDTADEFEGYVSVGPFYPYAWAYEYRFIHLKHNSSKFYSKHSRGMYENMAPGLENTTYLKATGIVSLPHKTNFIFSPIWLGMTEEGETFGYEFDNIFTAPIYDNFSYQFIFAYVIPSDYMKDNGLKDNAWAIRSQVQMMF